MYFFLTNLCTMVSYLVFLFDIHKPIPPSFWVVTHQLITTGLDNKIILKIQIPLQ